MTLGQDPYGAMNSLTPQVFDLFKVGNFQPRPGVSREDGVELMKASKNQFVTPTMQRVANKTTLQQVPKLENIPFALHRTDYNYVKSIINNNSYNSKLRAEMKEMMTGTMVENGAEKVSPFSVHIKAFPRQTRENLAALRKQLSINNQFTSSGRLVPSRGVFAKTNHQPSSWLSPFQYRRK